MKFRWPGTLGTSGPAVCDNFGFSSVSMPPDPTYLTIKQKRRALHLAMENPCPGLIPGACGFVTQFRLGTEFDTQVFEAVPQNAPSTKDTWISRKSNMFPPFCDSQRPGPQSPR